MSAPIMVYCTFPNPNTAKQVAQTLVEERLAACVNLVESVHSVYRWEGAICSDAECLTIIKTTENRFDTLKERLLRLHPYDCPEVVAVQITQGHDPYLQWVAAQTSEADPA